MALRELCTILQKCADKLEEEIKVNINDVHNLIYSKMFSETKIALEKAKDYHYKEILDCVNEILKNIKKIIFHQDKIEWLSHENNFTKDELRRFSYVKRQVFAFSQAEESPPVPSISIKKQKRRTASEISIGSLEAWNNYLDQKEKEETQLEEKVAELKPLVPKRTLSNARRRKKFVSSTLGGFLEDEERKRDLDSILENTSSVEENDRLSYATSLESLDRMILSNGQSNSSHEIKVESTINEKDQKIIPLTDESKTEHLRESLESLHNITLTNEVSGDQQRELKTERILNSKSLENFNKMILSNEESINSDKIETENREDNNTNDTNVSLNTKNDTESLNRSLENLQNITFSSKTSTTKENKDKVSPSPPENINNFSKENSEIFNIIENSKPQQDDESIINEIMDTFLGDSTTLPASISKTDILEECNKEIVKPKIVDVIYKKKPS